MAIATPNADHVSHDVEMRILLEDGTSQPMPCTMSYHVADPFAVRATFRSAAGGVTWIFSRELLIDGMAAAVGEGDIKVRPIHAVGRSLVRIELSSPEGRATLEGPMIPIRAFVDDTLAVLPLGFEWQHLNFDSGLAELLKGDAA